MKTKLLSLIISFVFAGTAFSQPAILQKSPADYAAAYDKQLPQPRQTIEEERLSRRVRQGLFARQLIKTLELEKSLPATATEEDCIRLLTRMGISPLKGWSRFAPLTQDDYAVIVGKAIGKEYLVHEKAQEVCNDIVKLLNVEWALSFVENNRYPILEKLITNRSIFPGKEPRCPYGVPYKVGGYKPHILPHKHTIKTPLKRYLYRERDILQEFFKSGQNKK